MTGGKDEPEAGLWPDPGPGRVDRAQQGGHRGAWTAPGASLYNGHMEAATSQIRLAASAADIAACYPVMRELRPQLDADEFTGRVQRQQADGYRLACLETAAGIVAVAGFRLGENLAWGRHLYVDDLVTLPAHRSAGHGRALLAWLRDYALQAGCGQLHLESGVQRKDAHRFYEREGMAVTSLHFAETLG